MIKKNSEKTYENESEFCSSSKKYKDNFKKDLCKFENQEISKKEDLSGNHDEKIKTLSYVNNIEGLLQENAFLKKQLDKSTHERDLVMTEMTDLSGSLYIESSKLIDEAHLERDDALQKLNESLKNEEALRVQNKALQKIIERNSVKSGIKTKFKSMKSIEKFAHKLKEEFAEKLSESNISNDFEDTGSFHLPKKLTLDVNEYDFDLFNNWNKENFPKDSPFMNTIIDLDVLPALIFVNPDLQNIFRKLMGTQMIVPMIEPANISNRLCEFMFITSPNNYYVSLENNQKYFACSFVRNILISITELYNYLDYIKKKLIKSSNLQMFKEIVRLRIQICLARFGITPNSEE